MTTMKKMKSKQMEQVKLLNSTGVRRIARKTGYLLAVMLFLMLLTGRKNALAAGELYPAYEKAHSLGLKIVGSAYLCGDETADKTEMDALLEHCNKGYVSVACVGNETLQWNKLTEEKLIQDISYVRAGLNDKTIPVTTSEGIHELISRPALINKCDILMPNCHPYWNGTNVNDAVNDFASSISSLQEKAPGKTIIVSETGWPSAGQTIGNAIPGESEAALYFDGIRNWSLSSGIRVLWFDAADEGWKTQDEGEAGAHWGLMDSDFKLKDGYAATQFFKQN